MRLCKDQCQILWKYVTGRIRSGQAVLGFSDKKLNWLEFGFLSPFVNKHMDAKMCGSWSDYLDVRQQQ